MGRGPTRKELVNQVRKAEDSVREAKYERDAHVRQLQQATAELLGARQQLVLISEDRDLLTATVECLARRLASPGILRREYETNQQSVDPNYRRG
jgi:hypothetical protein